MTTPRIAGPMREALQAARANPLRRTHTIDPTTGLPPEGKPPWPAAANTLAALVRRGLLERGQTRNRKDEHVDLWKITSAGRQALEPRERHIEERTVFLAWTGRGQGDFTTDPSQGQPDPVIDSGTLDDAWRQISDARRLAAQDRKTAARELARRARRAA